MIEIVYSLVNRTKGIEKVLHRGNVYDFLYPCEKSYDCTDYEITLPRGSYFLEAYGASGGTDSIGNSSSYIDPITNKCNQTNVYIHRGNAVCEPSRYSSGPGGYVSATLNLEKQTKAFIMIGGQGIYKTQPFTGNAFDRKIYIPGGYGGGGPARPFNTDQVYCASGGGRTALMMLEDDIFHSVLVAGAGGGSDDYGVNNNGKSGAGGGIIVQAFWIRGEYQAEFEARPGHFFTYGNGEAIVEGGSKHHYGTRNSPKSDAEYGGAGGGWYGGFSSYLNDAGNGGGSSFALTKGADIPTTMTVHDNFYENPITDNYAFTSDSEYMMTNVEHAPGIWIGNGLFRITILTKNEISCEMNFHCTNLQSLIKKIFDY